MSAQCSPPPAAAHRGDAAARAAPTAAAPAPDAARARAWLDVDLAALARNARRVRAHAGVPLAAMVKAEAYGLGAVPVARALVALGRDAVWGLGVASVSEGEALRGAGIDAPVVIFTPLVADDLPRAHRAGLTPSLHRADEVRRWAALGGGAWHLAVDTGMARAGVRWDALDAALLDAARAHPPEGAYTHFHSAERADGSRAEQEARFRDALGRLAARPRLVHAENSPAVAGGHRSPWDLVRPGLYLYGATCAGDESGDDGAAAGDRLATPEPVAHLRARVVDLREVRAGEPVSYGATWRAPGPRRVATVAAGYADGYRRALSGRGVALVGGREAPVVGRVTMDMTMLDVTDVPCEIGDVATLLGRDGDGVLTVDAVAARGDLSPYELLAGLRLRVPHLHAGA
jgi:alanine racemase